MTNKDALRRLVEYTVWANHRVLDVAAALSADDHARELGGSFGSLRGTLVHMYGAEWLWHERLKGVSHQALPSQAELADFTTLRQRWAALEEERDNWLRQMPDDAVSRVVAYRSLRGEAFEQPLWQLVQHVANHATYHRGQATMCLRLLGATGVGSDLLVWDREQRSSSRA